MLQWFGHRRSIDLCRPADATLDDASQSLVASRTLETNSSRKVRTRCNTAGICHQVIRPHDAKCLKALASVERIRGRDKGFRLHAPDPSACCAKGAIIDEEKIFRVLSDLAQCGEPSTFSPYNGYVDASNTTHVAFLHAFSESANLVLSLHRCVAQGAAAQAGASRRSIRASDANPSTRRTRPFQAEKCQVMAQLERILVPAKAVSAP